MFLIQFEKYFWSILFVSIFLSINEGAAQEIMLGQDREEVKFYLDNSNTDTYPLTYIQDVKDTLSIVRLPDIYPLECRYLFDDDGVCNVQIIKIYCSDCAAKFLNNVIDHYYFKFRKLSDSYYFSKRKRGVIMKVIKDEEEVVCTKIILDRTNWSRNEYRKYVKKHKDYIQKNEFHKKELPDQ